MFAAIASLTVLGYALGFLLGLASRYLKTEDNPVKDAIEAMMPGSQCGQCGFAGCGPAADAVVSGKAPATLCPPGGRALAEAIAKKLGISIDLSAVKENQTMMARINELTCTGCTRCFKVCPTDAIVGGPEQIHAVIMTACTGCNSCVEICPTESIRLLAEEVTLQNWCWPKPSATPALASRT